jgi:hypothetical protein
MRTGILVIVIAAAGLQSEVLAAPPARPQEALKAVREANLLARARFKEMRHRERIITALTGTARAGRGAGPYRALAKELGRSLKWHRSEQGLDGEVYYSLGRTILGELILDQHGNLFTGTVHREWDVPTASDLVPLEPAQAKFITFEFDPVAKLLDLAWRVAKKREGKVEVLQQHTPP